MSEQAAAHAKLLEKLGTHISADTLDQEAAKAAVTTFQDTALLDDKKQEILGHVFQLLLDNIMAKYAEGVVGFETLQLSDFIELLVWACQKGHMDFVSALRTLEDLFNALSINHCSSVFAILEAAQSDLINLLHSSRNRWGELMVLRLCNDLLGRISKCSHVEFSGRVLCFLAAMFDVTARSGVNMASLTNDSNVTIFEEVEPDDSNLDSPTGPSTQSTRPDAEEGETDAAAPPTIDFEFYKTLWGLQKLLRKADMAVSNPKTWKLLTESVNTLLAAFSSFANNSGKKTTKPFNSTKLLSSSALLKLQLSDPGFRQQLLVQILIALHTLTHKIRKDRPPTMDGNQAEWVAATTRRANGILEKTGASGPAFVATMKHLLDREVNWIHWKGTKKVTCVPFERVLKGELVPNTENESPAAAQPPKKFTSSTRLMAKAIGHASEVIQIQPEKLAAFMDGKITHEKPLETLDDLLNTVEEEDDPEAQIEDMYKRKNNEVFRWRVTRTLAAQDLRCLSHCNNKGGGLEMAVDYRNQRRDPFKALVAPVAPVAPAPQQTQDHGEKEGGGDEGNRKGKKRPRTQTPTEKGRK